MLYQLGLYKIVRVQEKYYNSAFAIFQEIYLILTWTFI